jgi:hypothetical protein
MIHNQSKLPWWKHLWNRITRRSAQAIEPPKRPTSYVRVPAPIRDQPPQLPSGKTKTVDQLMAEEVRIRRAFNLGPMLQSPPESPRQEASSWLLDKRPGEDGLMPLVIARHMKTEAFALVFRNGDDWFFWTGPKEKMFTPLGERPAWSTPNRRIAIITGNFLRPNVAAYLHGIRSTRNEK